MLPMVVLWLPYGLPMVVQRFPSGMPIASLCLMLCPLYVYGLPGARLVFPFVLRFFFKIGFFHFLSTFSASCVCFCFVLVPAVVRKNSGKKMKLTS